MTSWTWTCTIPGEPVAKGRPRFVRGQERGDASGAVLLGGE